MPKLLGRPTKGKDDDGGADAESGGGFFEKQVTKRVQPVVAALDRFRPALEENTREIKELTRALKDGK